MKSPAAFSEIRRVLKTGGHALLAVLDLAKIGPYLNAEKLEEAIFSIRRQDRQRTGPAVRSPCADRARKVAARQPCRLHDQDLGSALVKAAFSEVRVQPAGSGSGLMPSRARRLRPLSPCSIRRRRLASRRREDPLRPSEFPRPVQAYLHAAGEGSRQRARLPVALESQSDHMAFGASTMSLPAPSRRTSTIILPRRKRASFTARRWRAKR